MKNKDKNNMRNCGGENLNSIDVIQLLYVLYFIIYVRFCTLPDRFSWFVKMEYRDVFFVGLSAIFLVLTIVTLLHNKKYEKEKMTRWACYIAAGAGAYGFIYYLLFNI